MLAANHSYCVADYLSDGSGPALPRGIGFVLLAGPVDLTRWGVFLIFDIVEFSDRVRPVPLDVVRVLESGRSYPPALALARDEADGLASVPEPEFIRRYSDLIECHLKAQPAAPSVLAKAVSDEPGYLMSGQYYWVVEYVPATDTVRWVSEDYHVYQNPASDFALSDQQLRNLTKR